MGTLDFSQDGARRIERAYLTPDIVAQRAHLMETLRLKAGERVLDIGVGPGLLAYDLAEAVGPQGSLVGIDTSPAMVEMSQRRCAELPWARFETADAANLPPALDGFTCAVSAQVYEYVEDMPARA